LRGTLIFEDWGKPPVRPAAEEREELPAAAQPPVVPGKE
jgi:hypothetical protein